MSLIGFTQSTVQGELDVKRSDAHTGQNHQRDNSIFWPPVTLVAWHYYRWNGAWGYPPGRAEPVLRARQVV